MRKVLFSFDKLGKVNGLKIQKNFSFFWKIKEKVFMV